MGINQELEEGGVVRAVRMCCRYGVMLIVNSQLCPCAVAETVVRREEQNGMMAATAPRFDGSIDGSTNHSNPNSRIL
jgi:hypothetical protein